MLFKFPLALGAIRVHTQEEGELIMARTRTFGIMLVGAFSGLVAHAAETEMARVVGNRVNLRAEPELRSEVVGQVMRNDRLHVVSVTDEWVEVRPPEEVKFWVHGDFIDGDEISAPRLNVRAGPGINHAIMARLERGDRVVRRETFAEWVAIATPDEATVWIAREFVERELPPAKEAPQPERPPVAPTPAPAPTPEPAPEPPVAATPPRVVSPTVERPAPPPPPDLELIPLEGQGEWVELEGTLRPAGFVRGRPSRYRLTRTRGPLIETICYVKGDEAQLQALLGRSLRIRGRQYWVQGARYPLLVVDAMVLTVP